MKFAFVLLGLAIACHAETYEDIHSKMMPELNSIKKTWTAGYNPYLAGKSVEELHMLNGARLERIAGFPELVAEKRGVVPDTFDARQQWPQCPTIGEVRDQSSCGSCWAFGAVEVASDRTCIKKGQASDPDISPEDMLACCGSSCGFGCNGGYPIQAMNWWVTNGVVTGGNYGTNDGCQPYEIKPCPSGCPLSPTPKCHKTCQAGYDKTYDADKHHASSAYNVQGNEANIRQEIFNNGPVEAAFQVYQDFYNYHSGVYHHVSGGYAGGHAVKILGWGTESGTPYWLVANSWNTTWGDKGFFKIKRGNNECGFESGIVAGMAKD